MSPDVWTIGHSTRPGEALVAALQSCSIQVLLDVRRYPHSRRNPEYNADELRKLLFRSGIRYEYLGDELGGFRKARPDSPHVALVGSSFQGYADHLGTSLFQRGVAKLAAIAATERAAYMCSERMPKDCHRKILSDYLSVHGWSVHHILDAGAVLEHERTPTLRVVEGELRYAPTPLDDFTTS